MKTSPRKRFIALVTSGYVVFALAWIFLSDQLLGAYAQMQSVVWLSTAKGIFFVLASAALFWIALRAVPAETAVDDAKAAAAADQSLLGTLAEGMQARRQSVWVSYGFAVTITLGMLLVRLAISTESAQRPLLILMMLPIIFSALLGGLGPGLVSTAIAAIGAEYFFLAPVYSLRIQPGIDLFQWSVLVVNGIAVSLLSAQLQKTLGHMALNRRLLEAVVSGTSDAIFVKDRAGRYLIANQATANYVGRSSQSMVGMDDYALFPADFARGLVAKDQAIMASGRAQTHEEQLTTLDGRQLVFLVTKGPMFGSDGEVTGLFGISRDITERKNTEVALRQSAQELKAAHALAKLGNWEWDLASGRHRWSEGVYAMYGRDPALPPIGFPEVQDWFTPESWALLSAAVQACVEQGQPYACDVEMVRQDGSRCWYTARGDAQTDDQGRCVRLYGTLQDIDERKRTSEDLQTVLNEAGDAIWITDALGRLSYANPSAGRITGHTLSELRAMHIPDLLLPSLRQEMVKHLELLVSERFIRRNWTLLRRDGGQVTVEATTARMPDGRYMAFGRDLSEKLQADAALRDRELRLERVIEGTDQGYWDWNLDTQAFSVSARWETMLGYQPGEMQVDLAHWPEHVHPEDMPLALASIEKHMSGELPMHQVEIRCKTKSGDWRWILVRGRIVDRHADGRPQTMSGTHTDITERKLLELAQKDALTVFSSTHEGIMVVSPERKITKVNPAFAEITGYAEAEVLGRSPALLSSGRQDPAFYRELWSAVQHTDFWRGEIWNRRKNGEIYAELLSISVVRDASGVLQHYIGVFSDISQIKAHEAELDRIAHFDPLTGLANRRRLADNLVQAIQRSKTSGRSLAVCYMDLDSFKQVNDAHGHTVGDQLLIEVAHALKHMLRSHDTLARLGGDEFVLLLGDVASAEECAGIMERVLKTVSAPVALGELTVQVSVSMGVTLYPADNVDADTLLRHADQAMYLAKDAGKNRFHLFDPDSDRLAKVHQDYLLRLQAALAAREFVLHYQPKVDLVNGAFTGVEALIRWQHPERGLLSPAEFLPHIDGSRLEVPLGEWVMREALAQAQAWSAQGLDLGMSVNISANHLLQPDFHDRLQQLLAEHPACAPGRFELEVLETAAIVDMQVAAAILGRCHALGVHFALDDFGTGYSSLTYLRKLPVETLKIDQSFVRDMLTDAEDLGIVEGVIRLAKAFNREVIAEGVETLQHGAALLRLGCRLAQGYGIARPMPADQVPGWAERWQADQAWLDLRAGP